MFELMCAGGCNNDISPLISVIRNILTIIQRLSVIGILLYLLYVIIMFLSKKKKMTGKELGKKIVKYLIIAIVIYFVIAIILALIGIFIDSSYDPWVNCWCK